MSAKQTIRKHSLETLRQKPVMLHLSLSAAVIAAQEKAPKNLSDQFWDTPKGLKAKSSLAEVVAGMKAYQTHPWVRPRTKAKIIHQSGEVAVRFYPSRTQITQSSIVMIPSLINGSEILDFHADQSLCQYLTEQGYGIYLLEWGTVLKDVDLQNLDRLIGKKMKSCLTYIRKHASGEQKGQKLIGLGYCMGGNLLAATQIVHQAFDALIFIATPWNFRPKADNSAPPDFADHLRQWAKDRLLKVSTLDYMPHDWLQMIFASVDPVQIVQKYRSFALMDPQSDAARAFVMVEDWLNGGQDLPAPLLLSCIKDWYMDNKPFKGTWKINNQKIDANKISVPSLVFVPLKDRIVPPASSLALAHQIRGATLIEADCGHISMMVSKRARPMVWEKMLHWLTKEIS
jgi:polyhydroxyalkanoate synthase subunit PhaC